MSRKGAVLLLAAAVALTGCLTIAKEGYHTAVGASGKILEVKPLASLAGYDSVTVEVFANQLPGVVSRQLVIMIKQKTTQRLKDGTHLQSSGKKTLKVRGKIVHLDLQGLGSGMISPMEEVVCHVEIIGASGKMLGWASISGRSMSRARGALAGQEEVADGVAKGILNWLVEKGVKKREMDLIPGV